MTAPAICPNCGRASVDPLFSCTSKEVATRWCPQGRDPERHDAIQRKVEELWQQDTAQVFGCHNCDIGFAWPFVGGDAEYYSLVHQQRCDPRWRWEYEIALRATSGLPAGRWLDFGGGEGRFAQ